MSLPRDQKKSQMPWLDLAVFAAVVAFLGYSLVTFLEVRAPAKAVVAAIEPATPLPPPTRAPASQSGSGSTEVLRLPCLHDAPKTFESKAHLLQIHSPLCRGDEAAAWKASNATSGEEILVFVNKREKTVSTNYFSLKDGANELVFVEELGHGKTRQEKLSVMRSAE